ncbi:ArsR/SmtB family transcription factor [Microbacterium ulmi]|uniref:Helix-turn-helix domain-containing protein n=1 Tax=Microbacterium ulmi TaxID=179095 RepID=A0A7Y2Q019_9MICO|nr:helix-turn-helix domain-containing protein [Microbacterium ulmi]NII71133.1 DNA-binding transcriptional ArsR family regulator [Microbacterium ulmi]NNH02440.1 helix-turn-helix domain-containing protein [Microbacterium ulmi]
MTESHDAEAPASTGESRVLDAGALKALAHPLRVRIFDILSQYGPQTASSLAERLGESSGATSYHLRALAKHDLIREVEGRGTARERWWERPRGSVTMSSPDAVRTPSGRAASQIVITEVYRQRHEQLMHFIDESMRTGDVDETAADLSTATTRLTKEQFQDISERIHAIVTEAVEKYRDQQGDGVRTYLMRLDLFPIDDAKPQTEGTDH